MKEQSPAGLEYQDNQGYKGRARGITYFRSRDNGDPIGEEEKFKNQRNSIDNTWERSSQSFHIEQQMNNIKSVTCGR